MTATLTRPPPPLPDVAATPPIPSAGDPVRAFADGLVKFTFDDIDRLVRAHVLPEDSTVELLGGLFVYRDCGSSKGEPGMASFEHDFSVTQIGKLNLGINTAARHIRPQVTLRLAEDYGPVPDAIVLRGPATDYRTRAPAAADVLCLIEVADTSYHRDAGPKLAAYARAGVPQYVIVDFRNRTAEVRAGPDAAAGTYPPPTVVGPEGVLTLRVGDDGATFAVPLADVLP
jgi:hypothetical protein